MDTKPPKFSWSQPHPLGLNRTSVLVTAGVILFILVVLAPAEMDQLPLGDRIWVAIFFCIVTALAVAGNFIVAKRLFPRWLQESRWTLRDEALYNLYDLLLVALWNTLFILLISEENLPFWPLFMELTWQTLGIGLLPVLALIGVQQYQAQRVTLIPKTTNHTLGPAVVSLTHENGKLALQVPPADILYVQAAGNYLDVYFMLNGTLQKELVRNRLKFLLEQLPSDQFLICHKSYGVNLERVVMLEGNSRDLKLLLRDTTTPIPVSRSKVPLIKAALQASQ